MTLCTVASQSNLLILVWSSVPGQHLPPLPHHPHFYHWPERLPIKWGFCSQASPPSQKKKVHPLIRSCSSIGAEQNALEAFPWTPPSRTPGHSSILCSLYLPVTFPPRSRALCWPLSVNRNGSRHPLGHSRGAHSGCNFKICKTLPLPPF